MKPVTHAPADYDCPFCAVNRGGDPGPFGTTQDDIVYRKDGVIAFVAATWWPNNPGHVLVIPEAHYEHLYDIPSALGTPLLATAKLVALAMKAAYACDGITTRQSNEPAGNQSVWHYHSHVYPRYDEDMIFLTSGRPTTAEERAPYAAKLRAAIDALIANGEVE